MAIITFVITLILEFIIIFLNSDKPIEQRIHVACWIGAIGLTITLVQLVVEMRDKIKRKKQFKQHQEWRESSEYIQKVDKVARIYAEDIIQHWAKDFRQYRLEDYRGRKLETFLYHGGDPFYLDGIGTFQCREAYGVSLADLETPIERHMQDLIKKHFPLYVEATIYTHYGTKHFAGEFGEFGSESEHGIFITLYFGRWSDADEYSHRNAKLV